MMGTQHTFTKLAGLDDWQLEDSDQDLRGKMLMTTDGREVGQVDDMLADLDDERIVGLRLSDGRVVNVDAVDIVDGRPILMGQTEVPPAPAGVGRGEITSEHIPIVEEQLVVGKRMVELGTVRVKTRVISSAVSEDVSLREEQVNIDRQATNRPISAADADALFKDGTVEVVTTGEEAVVSKTAVVTGEVVVSKDATNRTETIEDTVRHTEVDIDRDMPVKR